MTDPFAERLARVRGRFVSSLEGKIGETCAAMPKLSAALPEAAAAVAEAYRCMHGIVGIGRSVGYPAIGQAARAVEDVLRSPYQSRRGLTPGEADTVANALQALRDAASRELQALHPAGE